jgi:hypothetical protein
LILADCLAYPVAVVGVVAHLWDAEHAAVVLLEFIIGILVIGIVLSVARPNIGRDASALTVFAAGQIVSLLLMPIFRFSTVLGVLMVLVISSWAVIWLPETRRLATIRFDRLIECGPDTVFRYVADPARMPLLSPGVTVELPPEGSLSPGYRYRYWMGPRPLPRVEGSVLISEYRPPELIAEVHRVGDDEYVVSWALLPEGLGTRTQFRQQWTMFWGEALLGGVLIAAIFHPSLPGRFRRLEALCKAET